MLLAAVSLPWLPFEAVCGIALGLLPFAKWGPVRFRGAALGLSCCLLWVFLTARPGANDLHSSARRPEAHSARLRFEVRGDGDIFLFPGEAKEVRTPVRVRERYHEGEWHGAKGRVQLRLTESEVLKGGVGSVWEASGVLIPGNFSYVGLYRADWKFIPDPGSLQALSTRQGSVLLSGFFKVRERLAHEITAACPERSDIAATLKALLLGQRSELDRETVQRFVRTGLIHVFAVSGLHLGLLSSMLIFVCRGCGMSPRQYFWVVLPWLMVFTLYTGLRASALRALIMIACLLLASPLNRKAHLQSAFSLALLLIVTIAPAQVYDLGFQYSFLLVGSLLAFGKTFTQRLQAWFAADPWLVPSAGRQFRAQYVWSPLQGAVMVTALCFVISAPLTAYTFQLFSPIGLVGNLLAVPLTFLLLASGFPALLTTFLPASVSAAAFLPARWSAQALLTWVAFLEGIPGGTQWVKSPALWVLCVFYGCLFCWWRWPQRKNVAIAGLAALTCFAVTSRWLAYREPELGIIDADRGQAVWFRQPGHGIVLVDAGSAWSGREVAQRLQEQGIDRIDSLIFTHPDRYHVEGWQVVGESYKPGRIFVAETDLAHPLFQDLEPPAQALGRGDSLRVGGWNVEVLHPAAERQGGSADDRSLVLRFTRGWSSILVMGGAGKNVEERCLASGEALSARILLAGHPREGARVHASFLEAVGPEVVVFSGKTFEGVSPLREAGEHRAHALGLGVLRVESTGTMRLKPDTGSLYIGKPF
ncbi:ComEC/Rec2 family competence protein [Kiritimatiellaeota bacterium B1221]|nr:ComEC/Rec2 family competence protein [Kiritimatiellaeota bacterium B1221]